MTVFGSKALEISTAQSDTDLIIIAIDNAAVNQIQEVLENQNDSSVRPELDCKIYTEEEFLRDKESKGNFFLWTAFMNSRVLLGEDISSKVKMNPSLVRNINWNSLEDLENACSNFESNNQFTGSCFSFYSSLTTLYFAEKYLLHVGKMKLTKDEYLKRRTGNHYNLIRQKYYWVAKKWRVKTSEIVRIPRKIDSKFSVKDYAGLHEVASRAVEYYHTKIAAIVESLEEI